MVWVLSKRELKVKLLGVQKRISVHHYFNSGMLHTTANVVLWFPAECNSIFSLDHGLQHVMYILAKLKQPAI